MSDIPRDRLTNWHVLAQQRSSSQDSHKSSDSDTSTTTGSDSNLIKRRHPDIRKSTLMKRFWESSKGNLNIPSFPSSYAEWQHGSYRSKTGSTKSLQHESPKHARPLQPARPSEVTFRSFATNVPKSEEDSYVVYSSRTDASDSYPLSTRSESVNNNNSSSSTMAPMVQATKAYRINNNGISDVTNEADIPNLPIKYQFVLSENENRFEFIPQAQRGKTNLNVITNVQLSQSTLNTIFDQVMQDVMHTPRANPEVLVDDNITRQKAFNFKLNLPSPTKEENNDQDLNVPDSERNNCIGEINVGSPYKSASPTVPRLSALPRTTSMEVNISSNDSLDKDSDTSLADSLDDPSSPRLKIERKTNINITKEKTLDAREVLEDEEEIIEKEETKKTIKKSSVFYIPIDDSAKSESDSPHVVSTLLPNKLKERLLHRQMKREEKRMQERMKAFDVENGNVSAYFSTSPETTMPIKKTTSRMSKKSKTTLPHIDLYKDYNKSLKANYTQRSLNRYRESVETSTNNRKTCTLPKTQAKHNTSQNQQRLPSKTKNSSTSAKHIEILEIMEIVEPERATQLTPKSKSRIPVFQHASGTKLPKLRPKPTFLDFGEVGQPGDPKLDQLIANILIDTLNHEDIKANKSTTTTAPAASQPVATSSGQSNNNPSLIEQAADMLTKQVLDNNNLDMVESVDVTEDIPKGWITFYMLQKAQSPDSTSDEGPKTAKTATKGTQYTTGENDADRNRAKARRKLKIRRKSQTFSQQDGWSLTLSNNNNLARAPEVEMKFKFPTLSPPKQESGLKFEDVCGNKLQSEIYKSKEYLRNPTNIKMRKRQITLSPRATKTSQQRTMLHRQRNVSDLHPDSVWDMAISGSGLNQIRRVPHMSELLLKRLISKLHRKQGVESTQESGVTVIHD